MLCRLHLCRCNLCDRIIYSGETFFMPANPHPKIQFTCYECGCGVAMELYDALSDSNFPPPPYGGPKIPAKNPLSSIS